MSIDDRASLLAAASQIYAAAHPHGIASSAERKEVMERMVSEAKELAELCGIEFGEGPLCRNTPCKIAVTSGLGFCSPQCQVAYVEKATGALVGAPLPRVPTCGMKCPGCRECS